MVFNFLLTTLFPIFLRYEKRIPQVLDELTVCLGLGSEIMTIQFIVLLVALASVGVSGQEPPPIFVAPTPAPATSVPAAASPVPGPVKQQLERKLPAQELALQKSVAVPDR